MSHVQKSLSRFLSTEEGPEYGPFSKLEPGLAPLPAGYQLDRSYRAVTSDILFDKDVAVDMLRPPGAAKLPAMVAWSLIAKAPACRPREQHCSACSA